ncbi:hypothetical protein [Limosilactobacillus fastidiosus]|uniref:Uncharacterized protein n=1 Tax=Limosilactobacillus fastidiosus TaxID=2759855 RepID=A0A7W3YBL7_9LACO|nr:hypothetical protein [Limosilactobacillus fastidiosus]MBB1063171.1 hypothetical protein [Limosilactobacillus fastidiosus]MBB1085413.1 hypothetical protein [Limosilactobacillus fastidiosus]MCD7083715.1 hypothetical protein [Limosilactobacillus fastidiosus]MCD7085395.1 hypothetical protein [Limosilactobacillus fastidiosus]MCD7114840.1 hypothetical protein [Limosilactobacillus fastidiosus]
MALTKKNEKALLEFENMISESDFDGYLFIASEKSSGKYTVNSDRNLPLLNIMKSIYTLTKAEKKPLPVVAIIYSTLIAAGYSPSKSKKLLLSLAEKL